MAERDSERERQHACRAYREISGRQCGMAQPGLTYNWLREILATYDDDDPDARYHLLGSSRAEQAIPKSMTNAGLIEHDVAAAGMRLAGKGRLVLELMRRYEWQKSADGTPGLATAEQPHCGKKCADACWTPEEGRDV